VHEKPESESDWIMKKTKARKIKDEMDDDLRPHYDIDYSKAKPNRFAKMKREQTVVLLDAELSKVFRTPEQVTHALRALIEAMPPKTRKS
jgi:hypothetical protein